MGEWEGDGDLGLEPEVPLFEQKKREYFFFLFFGRRKKRKNIFKF